MACGLAIAAASTYWRWDALTTVLSVVVTYFLVGSGAALRSEALYGFLPTGQTLQVKPKSQTTVPFEIAAQGIHRDVLPQVPDYLDVDLERLKATLVRRPKRAEVPVTCDVQMVVEHYSR